MYREFSTPIIELPSFLSTISMVVDGQTAIVQSLIQAERKSPPVYLPTRDLFLSTLGGKLRFEDIVVQARRLIGETERKCAVQIIDASEQFLRKEKPAHIAELPDLKFTL